MSRLEELIEKLCPDGVEYKKLGDLCSIITKQTGFDYTNHIKDRLLTEETNESVPYMQTKFFVGKIFNYNTDYFVPKDIVERFPKITLDSKCLLFSIVGASIGNVGLFPNDKTCFLGGAICVAKVKQEYNIDYLYYCTESNYVQHQIRRKTKGAGQATITIEDIREFTVPMPPIEVQNEIVRILDNFTELTAELTEKLTAELTARKKQYEYYRDELFSFGDDVPLVELSTVIKSLNTGLNPRQFFRLNTDDADNYYVTIREIQNNTVCFSEKTDRINDEALRLCNNRSNLEVGDVLFSGTGTIGETAIIDTPPVNWNIKEGVYTIKPIQDRLDSRFLMHLLHTLPIKIAIMKKVAGGTVKSIPMGEMKKLMIPLPEIEQQKRIVALLDRFDTLCNDISEGLPAEIEARQKQYEYYRDKLLTFKEKAI